MVIRPGKKLALLIAGPTASGKSAIGLDLAERFNGTIINTDAMQVYRELAVLSSRPTLSEEVRVPHRLYGAIGAAERFSAGKWLEAASRILEETWKMGRLPVFIGGTGLYFKLLEEGIGQTPDIPAAVRAKVYDIFSAEGAEGLRRKLPRDHKSLKDPQRLVRALEVLEATGKPLAEWQAHGSCPALAGAEVIRACLMPEREWLYARCNARFIAMMENGAEEEVRTLLNLRLDPELPAMKAIGVREIAGWLAGNIDRQEAIAEAQTQTRRYAKRQMTWYRGQMKHWPALDPADAQDWISSQLSEYLPV